LRMEAAEAVVDSVDLLETVGEPRRRQFIGSQPAAEVGKSSGDRREHKADEGQSHEFDADTEGRRRFHNCFKMARHGLSPSPCLGRDPDRSRRLSTASYWYIRDSRGWARLRVNASVLSC